MRKTCLCALIFASQLAFAQSIDVVGNQQITSDSQGLILPRISPAGDYVLVTGSDMSGLQKLDLATGELTTITTDRSAGFNVQFSDDGSQVFYRKSEYVGKLRYSSVNSINMATGEVTQQVKPTRNLQGLSASHGTILAVDNGKLLKKRVSGDKLKTTPAVPSIKEGRMYITVNGKTRQLTPNGADAGYLWPSVSPDGTKLLYYAINDANAYVCDLDGNNAVALGVLRAPVWMGNDWIIGMVDRDNGEVVTESQIFAVAANGNARTALTDKRQICMYPSASLDATKIVYTTADGKVYLMNVKTTK